MENLPANTRLISKNTLLKKTALSEVTIWRMRKRGEFPEPIKVGGNCVRWIESEVDDWISQQIKIRDKIN